MLAALGLLETDDDVALMDGKCASSDLIFDPERDWDDEEPEQTPASMGSARRGGETCTFWLDLEGEARGIGRPFLWGVERADDGFGVVRLLEEPMEFGVLPEALPKIPSDINVPFFIASSRLSIRTYSTASTSFKPILSSCSLCSFSLPFAFLTNSDSCCRRNLDSEID